MSDAASLIKIKYMASKFEEFKSLHTGKKLFVLPNAWNAESASILQEAGYPAVGTSSSAVAASLGYADGENMPLSEYLMIIRRIVASVSVPVTVDFEMGYGKNVNDILTNLKTLIEAGVVGINLEDSFITDGKRSLGNADEFATLLGSLKEKLGRQSLFINVRCDTYILNVNDKENETLRRLRIYESAGADGIFLPVISEEKDIVSVISNTKLPLNVMAIPDLPELQDLEKLGVRRVSMGPFLHNKTYSTTKEAAKKVLAQNSLRSIF
jgi:2-methylisocitrate lyase-like PEP mutase family enzyme